MSVKDDLALVAAWRKVTKSVSEHGRREGGLTHAGDALADRLEQIATVQDPCPVCGENLIPMQRGSERWSCKNHHVQVRR